MHESWGDAVPGETQTEWSDEEVADRVRSNPMWYHTIELRPGIVTPGWFDLRTIVDRLPWPDVKGKRCLDLGTYDGFLAFELERRGAAEVVATDIESHEQWDWPPAHRARGLEYLKSVAGEKGRGFEIAARALASSVRRIFISVYDLSPDAIGTFDVVVCGSLLLHLRDPFRALEAVRTICGEHLMSLEQIDLELSLMHRRKPLTNLSHINRTQWHVPNLSGHRQMIMAAGFQIERAPRPYSLSFGVAHPPPSGGVARRLVTRIATGSFGVPHSAVLARPGIPARFDRQS